MKSRDGKSQREEKSIARRINLWYTGRPSLNHALILFASSWSNLRQQCFSLGSSTAGFPCPSLFLITSARIGPRSFRSSSTFSMGRRRARVMICSAGGGGGGPHWTTHWITYAFGSPHWTTHWITYAFGSPLENQKTQFYIVKCMFLQVFANFCYALKVQNARKHTFYRTEI